jgi:transcriptional regulator with XRE-family HTH domain
VEIVTADGRAFGNLLRSHRAAAGLTQEALADRAGLSLDGISALERGIHRNPHAKTVAQLSRALGLEAADHEAMMSAAHPVGMPTAADTTWQVHQAAAWDLYVELTTRIAVARLGPDEGMLRETLTSLYSLFGTSRRLLKRHGRIMAQQTPFGPDSVQAIVMSMLDDVLRPFLSKWHPLLLAHENQRPAGVTAPEHERAWIGNEELRLALVQVRARLIDCARQLAAIAQVLT